MREAAAWWEAAVSRDGVYAFGSGVMAMNSMREASW